MLPLLKDVAAHAKRWLRRRKEVAAQAKTMMFTANAELCSRAEAEPAIDAWLLKTDSVQLLALAPWLSERPAWARHAADVLAASMRRLQEPQYARTRLRQISRTGANHLKNRRELASRYDRYSPGLTARTALSRRRRPGSDPAPAVMTYQARPGL